LFEIVEMRYVELCGSISIYESCRDAKLKSMIALEMKQRDRFHACAVAYILWESLFLDWSSGSVDLK
jgi:hypothetical protein